MCLRESAAVLRSGERDAGETEGWGFPIGHLDEVLFHGKVQPGDGDGKGRNA